MSGRLEWCQLSRSGRLRFLAISCIEIGFFAFVGGITGALCAIAVEGPSARIQFVSSPGFLIGAAQCALAGLALQVWRVAASTARAAQGPWRPYPQSTSELHTMVQGKVSVILLIAMALVSSIAYAIYRSST